MAQSLPFSQGNYKGCIAELALDKDFGHRKGDTQKLVEQLEFVAKACANLGIAGESCLLIPAVARVGLVALSSQAGCSVYAREIADTMDSNYPEKLANYRVAQDARQPRGYRSDVSITPVSCSGVSPSDRGQWLRSSIITSAYGQPLSLSPFHMGTDGMSMLSNTERTVLNLNQILCSSLIKDTHNDHARWRPAPARIKIEASETELNIAESVDGLILSLRTSHRAKQEDPQCPPNGSITLEWPRERVVHIDARCFSMI